MIDARKVYAIVRKDLYDATRQGRIAVILLTPLILAVFYNFSFRDAIKSRHRLSVPLPLSVARGGLNLAWKLSGWGGEPAWIDGLTKTLLINCRRAHFELGWRSRYSAAEVLART